MMRSSLLLLMLLSFSAAAQKPAPLSLEDLKRDVAAADDATELLQLARQMPGPQNADPRAIVLKRLVELRPHLGQLRYELAAAYAERDRKTEAYNTLMTLQAQGYALSPEDDPRFGLIATTPVWEHIVKTLSSNAQPFGKAEIQWRLPAEDLLIESLAWDESRKQLLVGGAREGAVYLVDEQGKLTTLVKADDENGMWAIFDIAIDNKRSSLWVASTAVPHFKGYDPEKHLGRAGIFEFDLKSGKLRNRYLSPVVLGGSFFMSSITLGPKGEVYAADGVNNAVYTITDGALKRVFHAPGLTSIRGLAVSDDGKILYTADYQAGIIGFDLDKGQPVDLRGPANLALGGLDGMVWWKGHLIVVQGGMSPRRVLRLKLGDEGRVISGAQVLQANHPEMDFPTLAATADDSVYVIGNSQKHNYDRFGLLKDASKLEGTLVFKLDADFSEAQPGYRPEIPRDSP